MRFDVKDFVESLPQLDLTVRTQRSEFEERVKRVRGELEKRGLSCGFAYGNEMRPGDTGWLTGYDPQIESAAVVVGPDKVLLIGGPEGRMYAEEMMQVGEYRNLVEFKIPEEDYPGVGFSRLEEVLLEACGRDISTIGMLTLPDVVPTSITNLVARHGKLVDASDILLDLRYNKSESEQKLMRVAAKISTCGMRAMAEAIEPGLRETEVAGCGEYAVKAMGADRYGFSTIVSSGVRASNVLGRASNKVIDRGDMVVLGISARYEGLTSCLGRTVVVGRAHPDQLELLQHALEAYEEAVEHLRYGGPARNVDTAARRHLARFGLSPLYSLVHGIGWTEAMEGKGAATQHSTYSFHENISVMVDLGIFGQSFRSLPPQRVGLRYEDPYLINSKGKTERLTDLTLKAQDLLAHR